MNKHWPELKYLAFSWPRAKTTNKSWANIVRLPTSLVTSVQEEGQQLHEPITPPQSLWPPPALPHTTVLIQAFYMCCFLGFEHSFLGQPHGLLSYPFTSFFPVPFPLKPSLVILFKSLLHSCFVFPPHISNRSCALPFYSIAYLPHWTRNSMRAGIFFHYYFFSLSNGIWHM